MFRKKLANPLAGDQRQSPYIVPHTPSIVPRIHAASRLPIQRRHSASAPDSDPRIRGHRGLRLVARPKMRRRKTDRHVWSWLEYKYLHQKHLDRGFLFLAASSALLLLLLSTR